MGRQLAWPIALLALACSFNRAQAMDLQWTRSSGQWRTESAPLLADLHPSAGTEILLLNRGGQLLLWDGSGQPLGTGQDGETARLPEGQWTSSPVLMAPDGPARILACSEEGLVVALDARFNEVWRHQLPGTTRFARADAVALSTPEGTRYCIADRSGMITALNPEGNAAWTTQLGGPCETTLQTHQLPDNSAAIFAAAGGSLYRLDSAGTIVWTRDLKGEILPRPEIYPDPLNPFVVCGANEDGLAAYSLNGERLWEAPMGDTAEASIVFLHRQDAPPLILCTGLWGNLYAFDASGRRIWTHVYDAKSRSRPLIFDANGDGTLDILVTTYGQRGYVFDADGKLRDELRFAGLVNASPILLDGKRDVLVVTNVLMTHCFRAAAPRPIYGAAPSADAIDFKYLPADNSHRSTALAVHNPAGALMRVNVSIDGTTQGTWHSGSVTARSQFEIPLPARADDLPWKVEATAHDARGKLLIEESWPIETGDLQADEALAARSISVWPALAYEEFNANQLARPRNSPAAVNVAPLYINEAGAGAFVVASTLNHALRLRVSLQAPALSDGTAFAGTIAFHEVVATGAVNGEDAADALPQLGGGNLLTLPPGSAAKIWVAVNSQGAEPGAYEGQITLEPLADAITGATLPIHIDVVDLVLPRKKPLTLCTWDYIPNNWFPGHTDAVLDDLEAHGVNVFPRTTLPSATLNDGGDLTFDWTLLDAELDRIQGRGIALFHLGRPVIGRADAVEPARSRALEIGYLRAFRDHLHARGLDYGDYALYPVDEPGLDYGARVSTFLDAATRFREADPKLQIYTDPVPGLSLTDYQRIAPFVDVWCPNMRLVNGLITQDPRMQDIMRSGKTLWSYECVSQVKSLSPLRYNRANAWRALYFGLSGIGFWTYSTTQEDHWIRGKTESSEYALVYPGAAPVSSLRWEAVRDGLEDAAAVVMLREAIIHGRHAGIDEQLLLNAEDTLRRAFTDIMELSDEAFIESRDFRKQGNRRIWHTHADAVRYESIRREITEQTLALNRALFIAT